MLHGRASTSDGDEPLFINLTPMIDIIMTLLVFFMTATKLTDWEEHQLDVNVPQVTSAAPLTSKPDDLVITIDRSGAVSFKKRVVSLDELRSSLDQAIERYNDQGVVISADGQALHQSVADVMSVCHAAGIKRIVHKVRLSNSSR